MEKGIEIKHTITIRNNENGETCEVEVVSTYHPAWPCFNVEYILASLNDSVEQLLTEAVERWKSES